MDQDAAFWVTIFFAVVVLATYAAGYRMGYVAGAIESDEKTQDTPATTAQGDGAA